MKDYWPSMCGEWIASNVLDKNNLDSIILNDSQADLLNVDGTIIMQSYNESGHKQKEHLLMDMSSIPSQIALTSSKKESTIGLNNLNGQFITTGIVIPESINNSFLPTNTLILFASRYSVEVPLELDKWVTFEVKYFTFDICRTDTSRSTTTTIWTTMSTSSTTTSTTSYEVSTNTTSQTTSTNETNILDIFFLIVMVIIVVSVSLGIIVFIIYYMNAKSEKREPTETSIVKSSSTETSYKSSSATKSFEPKSSQDYSKPIDLKSSSVNKSSSASASKVKNRPNELQVE